MNVNNILYDITFVAIKLKQDRDRFLKNETGPVAAYISGVARTKKYARTLAPEQTETVISLK